MGCFSTGGPCTLACISFLWGTLSHNKRPDNAALATKNWSESMLPPPPRLLDPVAGVGLFSEQNLLLSFFVLLITSLQYLDASSEADNTRGIYMIPRMHREDYLAPHLRRMSLTLKWKRSMLRIVVSTVWKQRETGRERRYPNGMD